PGGPSFTKLRDLLPVRTRISASVSSMRTMRSSTDPTIVVIPPSRLIDSRMFAPTNWPPWKVASIGVGKEPPALMVPPQLPSARWEAWTLGPLTWVALKLAPFPEATTMLPVGWNSGEAPEPELEPLAQAIATMANDRSVVRILMLGDSSLWRPS